MKKEYEWKKEKKEIDLLSILCMRSQALHIEQVALGLDQNVSTVSTYVS